MLVGREFARLAAVIDQPQWSADPRFRTLAARRANAAALDTAVAQWCASRSAAEAADVLQGAHVHSYPVNDVAELFHDEQLVFRRIWRRRQHAEIGIQAYCFPGFDLSETPGEITKAAPLLGEDNERVLREFVGLDPVEYAACVAVGVFD